MNLSHTFLTDQHKEDLFHAFLYLNACQVPKALFDDAAYGMERTHALRYVEYHMEKTDWTKAVSAIKLYAPRVVAQAEKGVVYFLSHYPQDAEYLKYPQVTAICNMLDRVKRTREEPKSNPILEKPKKVATKKKNSDDNTSNRLRPGSRETEATLRFESLERQTSNSNQTIPKEA